MMMPICGYVQLRFLLEAFRVVKYVGGFFLVPTGIDRSLADSASI